ncbi:hypothetical protein [Parerythrobacter lacustris]|uniref:Uncharacterized protein n=1 Tax=Parerythrobacter lacustris TaxID=2969984 RepID=A0ABT1XL94_9SPHN|nr:hypothetical protein [Parerythrobacter lacustris]MCR2832431.1 hypothetical protein [Parerythrobacter lacustris]
MTSVHKALILASAMILVAFASVFEFLPEQVAQFAPLGLLVFLPWAIGTKAAACGKCA